MNAHKLYKTAWEHWGEQAQLIVFMEELMELGHEIARRLRGNDNEAALEEEMADVTIMMDQYAAVYPASAARVWAKVRDKRARLAGRLEVDNDD